MKYAAVIYDRWNIIIMVNEMPSEERANKSGKFWTRQGGWYQVIEGEDNIEMYKAMINM